MRPVEQHPLEDDLALQPGGADQGQCLRAVGAGQPDRAQRPDLDVDRLHRRGGLLRPADHVVGHHLPLRGRAGRSGGVLRPPAAPRRPLLLESEVLQVGRRQPTARPGRAGRRGSEPAEGGAGHRRRLGDLGRRGLLLGPLLRSGRTRRGRSSGRSSPRPSIGPTSWKSRPEPSWCRWSAELVAGTRRALRTACPSRTGLPVRGAVLPVPGFTACVLFSHPPRLLAGLLYCAVPGGVVPPGSVPAARPCLAAGASGPAVGHPAEAGWSYGRKFPPAPGTAA